ncbi:MAG TPA: hypothetical protein VJ725_21535 [Thermoanaerobaculia bacterium]|nr:hypothetical protein [Thermoanaerobaculia bacterium]
MILTLTDDERRDLIAALDRAVDFRPEENPIVPRWRALRARLAAMAQPESPADDPDDPKAQEALAMRRWF